MKNHNNNNNTQRNCVPPASGKTKSSEKNSFDFILENRYIKRRKNWK